MSFDRDITALIERLREVKTSDHERGCQGREYACSCGWDERVWSAVEEAADALEACQAEVEHQRREQKYWYDRYAELGGRAGKERA